MMGKVSRVISKKVNNKRSVTSRGEAVRVVQRPYGAAAISSSGWPVSAVRAQLASSP